MKIIEVINEIRNNEVGIFSITLEDASHYANNARGSMSWTGTLFTKKYVNRQKGDEVIATGNKETNVTSVEQTLASLIGKGDVVVRFTNGKTLYGPIEA